MIDPELIPLGVSEPEGRIGAVSRSQVDVDLIDLITGQLLRRLPAIGSPLMIDGQHLLGWQIQPDRYRLGLFRVGLPPAEAAVEWSQVFDLPEWVDPQPSADMDFVLKFGREADSYLLFWKARRRYRGGAPPPPQLLAEIGRQDAHECIDFDVRTLAVLRRRDEDGFADERSRDRRGEYLARHADGFVYRQAGQLRNAPWMTSQGERYLRSLGTPGAVQQRLAIVQDGTADSHHIASIDAHELDRAVPELSLDGQHLAVVERAGSAMVLRIYSALNGERIASLPYQEGFRSFRIFDRRLLYLEEKAPDTNGLTITQSRALRAIDSGSGQPLWSYEADAVTTPNPLFLPPGSIRG